MWDLPRPGLEPASPALAGRLSTTAPPGKPRDLLLTAMQPPNACCALRTGSTFTKRANASSAESDSTQQSQIMVCGLASHCWNVCIIVSVVLTHATLHCAGVQGGPPQSVPQWHIDYFELKLLKKWPRQEEHSNHLLFFLKAGNKSCMWKACSLHLEGEGYLVTRDREFRPRRLCKQTLLLLSFTTPSPNCV